MLTRPGHHSNVISPAVSHASDAATAVAELAAQIDPDEICFLLVFVPVGLDRDRLAAEMLSQFAGIPVFGCTAAGQITPQGYDSSALLAIGFSRAHFRCASMLISPLKPFSIKDVSDQARKLAGDFHKTAHWNRLGLVLADGTSKQEDILAATLATALNDIPVFGGSASDGLEFRETLILHGGRFHPNAALLILLDTDMEFRGLGFDHFQPTDTQMVVTDAVPDERLVLEINGTSAAREYARMVGCAVEDLSAEIFAENPVLVRNNALYHVRSIKEVHPDGTLSLISAIDVGLLLTLGKGQEILRTLADELCVTDAAGHAPEFILGFDCILRRLEIDQKQLGAEVSQLMRQARVLGFNTYGEQHCGVHVNQTFVGVAFFPPQQRALH
ncbi:FIST N-terminal domain-containing protein [Actibacterium ureilyticum]|uniref:FIST N-terminal domain-containing protein n=1 Tax=Actibacterium ureilyticum TaxID=1590614 RepID=UPI000BAAC55F|nr:FIST N-terminal domain-containing protein [Actibacterium ureilyticum]